MRFCVAGIVSIFISAGMLADAQATCFGPACPPSESDGIGGEGFFETYRDYWPMDLYQAQTQWSLTQTTSFQTREQCVEDCKQAYLADLEICRNVHGVPTPDEDPAISQSRINCADAMRQQEIQCISPASLFSCPGS